MLNLFICMPIYQRICLFVCLSIRLYLSISILLFAIVPNNSPLQFFHEFVWMLKTTDFPLIINHLTCSGVLGEATMWDPVSTFKKFCKTLVLMILRLQIFAYDGEELSYWHSVCRTFKVHRKFCSKAPWGEFQMINSSYTFSSKILRIWHYDNGIN